MRRVLLEVLWWGLVGMLDVNFGMDSEEPLVGIAGR